MNSPTGNIPATGTQLDRRQIDDHEDSSIKLREYFFIFIIFSIIVNLIERGIKYVYG